jgi:aryl-alcohol dehydrogenase-like predicted oxidoreductase
MEYRKLGKSDLHVSVLGVGTWPFGGGDYWGAQSQDDVDQVVHRALDLGINFFDTAEMYNNGASETSLGIALKGKRDRAIIGSKVTPANAAPATMRKSCEQSLKRLGTDYIDVYMLHWPISSHSLEHFTSDQAAIARPPSIEEAFATMKALKNEGKIRAIGMSNHGVKQMDAVLGKMDDVVTNEMPYSLLSRAIEDSIIPYCAKHDIGIIAYMPLQQGLLTGLYGSADEIAPMQARSRHFHHSHGKGTRHGEEGAEAEVFAAIAKIKQVAAEQNVTIAVLSLAWVMANKYMTTTIAGSRTLAELSLNVGAVDYKISPEVIERLKVITAPVLEKLGSNPDYYENRLNSRIE